MTDMNNTTAASGTTANSATANSATANRVTGSDNAVDGVFVGVGLVPVVGVDLGGFGGGPFLSVDVVGADGVVGVVGVIDNPDSPVTSAVNGVGGVEGLLGVAGEAAGVVLGGGVVEGVPVGVVGELVGRVSGPVVVTGYVAGDELVGVFIALNDRRSDTDPGSGGVVSGDPFGVGAGAGVGGGLEKLFNVGLDVSVELGRTRVTLSEVLDYDVGSIVELDRAAGAPVDVRVNDTLLAQGEVVLIDDEYAVRITAILDPGH